MLGGGERQVFHERAVARDAEDASVQHRPRRRAVVGTGNDADQFPIEPRVRRFHAGLDGDVQSGRTVVEQQRVTNHRYSSERGGVTPGETAHLARQPPAWWVASTRDN